MDIRFCTMPNDHLRLLRSGKGDDCISIGLAGLGINCLPREGIAVTVEPQANNVAVIRQEFLDLLAIHRPVSLAVGKWGRVQSMAREMSVVSREVPGEGTAVVCKGSAATRMSAQPFLSVAELASLTSRTFEVGSEEMMVTGHEYATKPNTAIVIHRHREYNVVRIIAAGLLGCLSACRTQGDRRARTD